ncbi:MAG: TlpA family protein disulfide reductase [Desulfobacterota bacterium]|nr:TlpA family protein disulfide reductase [Thermodesulfobacteriota bacterium]
MTLKRIVFITSFILMSLICVISSFAITIGDPFPIFTKPNTLTPEECAQLGIVSSEEFSLSRIRHDVTILEFLNVYCHTCRQQVHIFNQLNEILRNDPEIAGKACIIGIAVGNTESEIADFKKSFGANYPILPDPKKEVFTLTGNLQGTPHTYILRKEDQRFIIDYHAGGVSSPDRYLETVRFALRGTFTGTGLGNKIASYSFTSKGKTYDASDFEGKPIIMYFPVKKVYPVEIDTRNRGNQIKILHDIRRQFPEVTVIAFQGAGIKLPQAISEPSFLIAEESQPGALRIFRSDDAPTVYFINRYGRISFKGEAITLYNAASILRGTEYKPELKRTDQDIIAMIERRITAQIGEVDGTEKEVLDSGKAIYVTALKPRREGVYLFSIVESRASLCDICHDSHFVYVCDQSGILKDFFPIEMTKLGNIPWNEEDIKKIRNQTVGKSIFGDFSFDPKADAVTTATMSSSLIYEALNDAKKVLATYKGYKFRYDYWKEVCFGNICKIKAIAAKELGRPDGALSDDLLANILAEHRELTCPHDGAYIVFDRSILCSIHGVQTKPCDR